MRGYNVFNNKNSHLINFPTVKNTKEMDWKQNTFGKENQGRTKCGFVGVNFIFYKSYFEISLICLTYIHNDMFI